MTLREKTEHDSVPDGGDGPGNDPSAANLRRMRLAGQGFLSAGADAIQKALSGDSESFLAATRQQGGQ
jgi:hypothetical protein